LPPHRLSLGSRLDEMRQELAKIDELTAAIS
jgi:hypothetical protein